MLPDPFVSLWTVQMESGPAVLPCVQATLRSWVVIFIRLQHLPGAISRQEVRLKTLGLLLQDEPPVGLDTRPEDLSRDGFFRDGVNIDQVASKRQR